MEVIAALVYPIIFMFVALMVGSTVFYAVGYTLKTVKQAVQSAVKAQM